MSHIRVVIVDDSVTIRAMLEEVLGRERDIDIVGIASDAADALRLLRKHRPDVATIDIAMPGVDGLGLLDAIVADHLTHPVMLSSHSEAVADAFARGAAGFFDKSQILRDAKLLVRLIRKAAEGKVTKYPTAQPNAPRAAAA